MVDDEEGGGKQEMVYEVTAEEEKRDRSIETIEREETDGKDREAEGGEAGDGGEERAEGFGAYGGGEVPGGVVGVDGETQTGGGMPGVGGGVEGIEPVAGPGDGGDAPGVAATGTDVEKGVALSPRLAVLLERKSKGGGMKGLERRLARLQGSPVPSQGNCGRLQPRRRSDDLQGDFGWRKGDGGTRGRRRRKLARERALVILQVRSGDLTAKEGAERLGVSRKTYYEWEEQVAQSHGPGVGESASGEAACACGRGEGGASGAVQELEKKLYLAEKTIEVKELLAAYESFGTRALKKTDRSARGDKKDYGDC